MHSTHSISLIVIPLTFVVISAWISHFSFSTFHAWVPLSFINWPIFISKSTLAMTHSIEPLALIFNSLLIINIFSLTISKSILNSTFKDWTIRPFVTANASDFIHSKLSLIDSTISPRESSFAMKQSMLQFSFVFMPIFELTCTLPMINFTNLSILFIINNFSRPVFNN